MGVENDCQAMERVRRGRLEALSPVYVRHRGTIFGLFLRLTRQWSLSEDLTQEVFLRVLKYVTSFRADAPFKPWLYQIARRVHLDHLDRAARQVDAPLDLPDHPSDPDAGPIATLVRTEDQARVSEALRRLDPRKRELLLLSRDPDLTCQDLATLFDCTPGAAKVAVHRALKDLRRAFLTLDGDRR